MIEQGIHDILADLADTYPVHLPEGFPRPCITYRRISSVRRMSHDGPVGLVSSRFQITIHASDHLEAVRLADRVRVRLDGRVDLPTAIKVSLVEIVNELDLGFSTEADSWQIATDAIVHHGEELGNGSDTDNS
ncbi:MAG: hypothetical protein AMS19_02665 [Gemmatimonas sp. SG8_23]|jgi:hypothetical protein|nr:MAG: hypothetical protein AMS19_02665 [Gemmatimonas sp. SG8_23]